MALLKKSKNVDESYTSLEKIFRELNEIHNLITNGDNIDNKDIEALIEKLRKMAKIILEACKGLKNKYKSYLIFYFVLLLLVWSVFSAGVLFGAFGLNQIVSLLCVIVFILNNLLNTVSLKKNMDKYISDTLQLAEEESRRIDNYTEILFKRKTKKLVLDNSKRQTREANELEIANDFIGKYLDNNLVLRYVPDNIKNAMIRILQSDLGTNSTDLEELLSLADVKSHVNAYEKKRVC